MKVRNFFNAITAVALMVGASQANAVLITIGDTSGNNNTDVSGELDFTIADGAAGSYVMNFSIQNTSAAALTTRLTGVAFDLIAGSDIFASTSPTGWGFEEGATLPGEASAFDACFYSGSNCGAGGSGGLLTTDGLLSGFSVSFTYAGGLAASAVEALQFAAFESGTASACMRFISIGAGDLSDVACQGDPVSVPEPATAALFGLGLLGLGWMRRRPAA